MPMAMRNLAGERGQDRDFIYLIMLARKYGLEPGDLHRALVKAKGSKEATCGSLSVELRERADNTYYYMFSQNNRAVAQTAISDDSLAKLRELPEEFTRLLNSQDRQCTAELERRIGDLQIGLRRVNLKARVIDKSEIRAVQSRDGSPLVVCSATLSDGTGKIRLPLWNNQINSVSKNDTVIVRDAAVRNFRGEMQLYLPRKIGSISIVHAEDGIVGK